MIFILVICFFSEFLVFRWYQDLKSSQLKQEYIFLEDEIDDMINNNFNVMKGFSTYLSTVKVLDQEEGERFVLNLIDFENSYVRTIGVLEDTTIIWSLPSYLDQSSVGVDLGKIPDQMGPVLEAKEQDMTVLHGPINLIQGGIGFIIRIPFERDGTYYGQVSVVLDGDKFTKFLKDIERKHGVHMALSNEYGILYRSNFVDHKNDLVQAINDGIFSWRIRLQPEDGWVVESYWYTLIPFVIIVLSILIGYKSYNFFIVIEDNRKNAIHDPLTNLFNRHYLYRYADKAINISKINQNNLGVMVIDINNFKSINDNYGHQIGDQVLIDFASKLKMSLRAGQEVFRIGGDEFLLVFENVSDRNLLQSISIRIKSSIENYPIIDSIPLSITLSMGMAIYPEDGKTLDDLYNYADNEMYKDKDEINES
jgi:diguanylate cyclase (GGDEF)-like protein